MWKPDWLFDRSLSEKTRRLRGIFSVPSRPWQPNIQIIIRKRMNTQGAHIFRNNFLMLLFQFRETKKTVVDPPPQNTYIHTYIHINNRWSGTERSDILIPSGQWFYGGVCIFISLDCCCSFTADNNRCTLMCDIPCRSQRKWKDIPFEKFAFHNLSNIWHVFVRERLWIHWCILQKATSKY